MRRITQRELRTHGAQLWTLLEKEGEILLTKRGKAVALLVWVEDAGVAPTLREVKMFRGWLKVHRAQAKLAGSRP